jgi:hypothetical protein
MNDDPGCCEECVKEFKYIGKFLPFARTEPLQERLQPRIMPTVAGVSARRVRE